MTDKLEEVGDAVLREMGGRRLLNDVDEDLHDEIKIALARAAIEAMREPTVEIIETMVSAFTTEAWGGQSSPEKIQRYVYDRLIDAALAPADGGEG
jgi:hypothetical protein